jgi:hypothetical protein
MLRNELEGKEDLKANQAAEDRRNGRARSRKKISARPCMANK